MELLNTNIVNLSHNEENIEVKVETATVGVLKEVSGFGDGSALQVDGVVGTANRGLDPGAGANQEAVMPPDEALGDVNPRS